jgi:cardiolipin synthase (CMP-forming)
VDDRLNDGVPSPGEATIDSIWTIPNGITVVRLACLPLYLYLLFGGHHDVAAAILLGLLGITDFVDGFLARRLGQVSNVGKIIDPVADRLLMLSAVITVAWVGAVPWWFAGLTLAREVLVSAATLTLASLGARRIDVLWIGKAGTLLLMVAYPAFLLGHGPSWWQGIFRVLGWATGPLGLACAWVALASYLAPARQALAEGRSARAARRAIANR